MPRRAATGFTLLLLAAACIIPDAEIEILPERNNPGAVRLVNRISMSVEANRACTKADPLFAEECPLPPPSQPPGLVDFSADGQPFCSCPPGERDNNALRQFDVFVEDPDVDNNVPRDDILGAFLLDVPLSAEDPSEYVAYQNYLPSNEPATLFPIGRGGYNDAIERPTPSLKSWTIGIDGRIDLCNDNVGGSLEPGLHQLTLVVTDRPWYTEVQTDDKGKPLYKDGELVRTGDSPRIGVPDLPVGATSDSQVFVFRCLDSSDQACNCSAEEES
jgi:hypothetical protein